MMARVVDAGQGIDGRPRVWELRKGCAVGREEDGCKTRMSSLGL